MTVEVRHSPTGQVVVVSLIGEHDISTAPEVRRALAEVTGVAVIVVDLGPTTFLDSTILGVLMSTLKQVRVRGGRLCAVNAAGPVAKVLRMTQLDTVLQLTSTDDSPLGLELRDLLRPTEIS